MPIHLAGWQRLERPYGHSSYDEKKCVDDKNAPIGTMGEAFEQCVVDGTLLITDILMI